MKSCHNCKSFFQIDFAANEFESPDWELICDLEFPPLTEEEIIAIGNGTADFDENIASKCTEYRKAER